MEDQDLEDIENSAQEEPSSPEQPTESLVGSITQKPKPWVKVGMVVVIALILGLIGYLIYRNYQPRKQPNSETTPSRRPSQSTTTNETAGWEKYTDEKYGFSFSYPSSWLMFTGDETSGEYIVTVTTKGNPMPGDLEIEYGADFDVLAPEVTLLTLDDWLETQVWITQPEGEIPVVTKGLQLDGEDALKVYTCQVGCSTIIYAKHDGFIFGLIYFIGDKERDQHEKTINQILSTFKFLDQTQADETASWETYTNENDSYTFRYPAEVSLEEGDGVHLSLWGPTQKQDTEFYDGISLHFSSPFELGVMSLEDYTDDSIEASKESADILKEKETIVINGLNGYTYTAQGLGTFQYVFLQSPNGVWAVEITDSTSDPTNQGYQGIVDKILFTFEFLD